MPLLIIIINRIFLGFQDTGIAIILLVTSFPAPDGDLAAAMPMMIANCTPLPMIVVLLVLSCRRGWAQGKCQRCGGPEAPEKEDSIDHDEEKKDGMTKKEDGQGTANIVYDGDVQRREEKRKEAEASNGKHHISIMDSTYM